MKNEYPTKMLIAFASLVLCVGGSQAATMTFDGIAVYDGPSTYLENGIFAQAGGGGIASYDRPEAAHLDDSGTSFASSISFTMDRPFNAISFDLFPVSFAYIVCVSIDGGPETCTNATFNNVQLRGFRAGSLVVETAFDMGEIDRQVALGTAYRNLDSLSIGFAPIPRGPIGDPEEGMVTFNAYCDDSPCSHFDLDNVTLAPVPVPASILSLGAALGMIAAIRRRKSAGSGND